MKSWHAPESENQSRTHHQDAGYKLVVMLGGNLLSEWELLGEKS